MGERGFTLVELLVAMFLLLVGMGASIALLDGANAATSRTKAREQGVALQRELVEAARSAPYESLVPGPVTASSPASVAARVHAVVGGDTTGGWTVRRRDVTYTVSVGVCTVDDANDGTGAQDAATFCASGAGDRATEQGCRSLIESGGGGSPAGDCGIDVNGDGAPDGLHGATSTTCPSSGCDRNPDDYKRIVTLVTWQRDGLIGFSRQSSTVVNPGLAAGPPITALRMKAPQDSETPVTITNPTLLDIAFEASTGTRTVSSVAWSIDGTQAGTAADVEAGRRWAFSWSVGTPQQTVDGVYVIGAKAFDRYGVFGPGKAVTVDLDRAAPFAPVGFVAGRNRNHATGAEVVEFEWAPNRERDILRYHVYEAGTATKVCNVPAKTTSCPPIAAPTDPSATYEIAAVDRNGDGARTPDPSTPAYAAPDAPTNVEVVSSAEGEVIRWALSASSSVVGYRIYRNGVVHTDRINRVAKDQVTYTDRDAPGATPTYYVTAVTADLAESTPAAALRIASGA